MSSSNSHSQNGWTLVSAPQRGPGQTAASRFNAPALQSQGRQPPFPPAEQQERVAGSTEQDRLIGVVDTLKYYDNGGGFGFLRRYKSTLPDAREYNVHFRSRDCEEFLSLEEGSVVEFTLFDNNGRANARDVVSTGKVIELPSNQDRWAQGARPSEARGANPRESWRASPPPPPARTSPVTFSSAATPVSDPSSVSSQTTSQAASFREASAVSAQGNSGFRCYAPAPAPAPRSSPSDPLGDCNGIIKNFAFFPESFPGCIKELAEKAMPENWSYKDENGTVRPYGLLENYVNMAFKYIVTHQREVLKFSEDGSWVVFDTRLLTRFDDADRVKEIYALFRRNDRDEPPYCFVSWSTWGGVNRNRWAKLGANPPKAFSTELSDPEIPTPPWWKEFDADLTLNCSQKHILFDNIERLRPICTPLAAEPQEKCWLFLGTPDQKALGSFFETEKELEVKRVTFVASSLAYAEFNSPDFAVAVREWCIKEEIKIGGTILKPVLSQGPPTESEVTRIADKLAVAIDGAKTLAKLNPRRVLPQLFLRGGLKSTRDFVRQLLLPLHLNAGPVADAALTVEIISDRTIASGWYYFGSTVLTLDMAFNNARLVNSVESPWLCQAVRIHEQQQAYDQLAAECENLALAAQAAHHHDM